MNNMVCYIVIGFCISICISLGIILNKTNKLINKCIEINKDINKLYSKCDVLKLLMCDETNFIKDKLGIVIRHSNNIRDNVQVTKLNTANILKNVEKKNKAKISYTPNELRKSSDDKSNGQEKLKTAKNEQNIRDNVRKYEKD